MQAGAAAELAAQLDAFRGEQGNLLAQIGAAAAHAVRILACSCCVFWVLLLLGLIASQPLSLPFKHPWR